MSAMRPSGGGDEGTLGFVEIDDLHRLLIETVRDYAIFALNRNGYVLSWNPGAQRFKGYTASEIIGRHFSIFYTDEARERRHPQWELEVATREGRYEEEGWRVRKDGTLFWANVTITALRDASGELSGFAKVTRDLTVRKALQEQAIEDARRLAIAETANRARVRDSQQHLLALNDLLNFSRLEAGRVSYDTAEFEVGPVVDGVVALLEAQASLGDVVLELDACPPDAIVRADSKKVEQIVLNLLMNAIKFTGAGGRVTVGCAIDGDRIAISVADTGTGIDPAQLESIFEPFVQLGRNLTSSHEGTGLGLSISRELARAMGGDLTVTSEVGRGSKFTALLPRG